jgi:hypothetical protein
MDAATRRRIREARDARQRELIAAGGLRSVDAGRLAASADEAEARGYPEIAAVFRRLESNVLELYRRGWDPERVEDALYRWLGSA